MTTTGSTHSGALPQVEDLGARGYRVTGIVATDDSYLFATAIRETDNLAVMLKAPLSRNPSRVQLARIRHEFSMHRQFTHPSLAVALELAPCSNGLALVTAVNGTSLRALVATGSLELGVCLAVGIGVLKALECLHSGGYVHRDIKPASIHFDSNTQQVTLTNLALTANITTLSHPENVRGKLCGSPHYLAPEQTGYMNRPVDHRADYYALGSTLYECMTGAPPFSGDLQETIYAHLARTPVPLDHALPDCPRAVVETINKLLCKEPNNRYQSPHGLRSDLEYCHALVTSRASDPSRPLTRPFVAGSEDVSTVLRIPNALFGRKQLLARLLEYFTTEATGVKHLFLSGPVGIGKSTLVGEMMPQVARSHALFGQGNCEPGQANIPYSVLLSALDTALRHAGKLARDEPTRMANALTFAPVLSDSLPALEELLGPLAPAPVLPIKEAGERFFAAMREVLRYLVSSCSRCVLIFEDVQWADPATLNFLASLTRNPAYRGLCCLYTFTFAEGDEPLSAGARAAVKFLHSAESWHCPVAPLTREDTGRLVASTFGALPDARTLTNFLVAHCEGLPGRLRLTIQALVDSGAVLFDHTKSSWVVDSERMANVELPASMLASYRQRCLALGTKTLGILEAAACQGNVFSVEVLCAQTNTPFKQTFRHLREAEEAGLIFRERSGRGVTGAMLAATSETACRFTHTRVREVLYHSLDVAKREVLHLNLGRYLRAHPRALGDAQRQALVVEHMARGYLRIESMKERLWLVRAHLGSAKLARSERAFQTAATLCARAREMLPAQLWGEHLELRIELGEQQHSSQFLSGKTQQGLKGLDTLAETIDDPVRRAKTEQLAASLCLWDGDFVASVDRCIATLNRLGVELLQASDAEEELISHVEKLLHGWSLAELCALPTATDRRQVVALATLSTALIATFVHGATITFLRVLHTALHHSLNGATEESARIFSDYAIVLASLRQEFTKATMYSSVALEFAKRGDNPFVEAYIRASFQAFITPWTTPYPKVLEGVFQSVRGFWSLGQTGAARMAYAFVPSLHVAMAIDLELVEQSAGAAVPGISQGFTDTEQTTLALQYCRVLRRGSISPTHPLSSECFDEPAFLATLKPGSTDYSYYYLLRGMLLFHSANYPQAEEAFTCAKVALNGLVRPWNSILLETYTALNLAACLSKTPSPRGDKRWQMLERHHRQLRCWAQASQENAGAACALVEGVCSQLGGDREQALSRFLAAKKVAEATKNNRWEGLACTYAAAVLHDLGHRDVAIALRDGAVRAYTRWGAHSFVQKTEAPTHRAPVAQGPTHHETAVASVDLETLLRATRAIASELDFGDLLQKMMQILVSSSGARRCLFFTTDVEETLLLEAVATPEQITRCPASPLEAYPQVPHQVVRKACQRRLPIVVNDTQELGDFCDDLYFSRHTVRSLMCIPLINRTRLLGAVYLENDLTGDLFSEARVEFLRQLALQIAISIDHARLYHELDEAREQAVRADQVKTNFLMNMSHEFRTPLTSIIGYADLLADEARDGTLNTALLIQELEPISLGATRLLKTLTGILELSRIEAQDIAVHPCDVDIRACARELLDTLTERAQGTTLRLIVDKNVPESVYTDPTLLTFCMTRMLENALEFDPNGEVSLQVEVTETSVRVIVADKGCGMTPEVAARVFEPFFQADSTQSRRHEGAGVSLAVCKRFAEHLGGNLHVQSTVNIGSKFILDVSRKLQVACNPPP